MNIEQAKALLQRYVMGLCTDEEAATIESWYNDMVERGVAGWTDQEKAAFGASLKARTLAAILAEETPMLSRQPVRLRLLMRYAAAAVVLLLLGTGWYFLNTGKTRRPLVSAAVDAAPQKEILPGKTGAILTLADGQQIVLDSAVNGRLAIQGAATIVHKDGKVFYHSQAGPSPDTVYNTMTTPKGRQYALVLSDGTRVWLNASASITYPAVFGKNARKVSITGEAYFEVAKDAARPFTVTVRGLEVQVLGTHFNINAYEDEPAVKTSLLEGAVKMISSGREEKLRPGEQGRLDNNGVITVQPANVNEAIAWKNGLFSFTDADLPTVMRQLARWYNVEVIYAGTVPVRQFDGKIGRELTLLQVLKVLNKTRVKYQLVGDRLTILP